MKDFELKSPAFQNGGKGAQSPENQVEKAYNAFTGASNIGIWEYDVNSGFLKCDDIYFVLLGRSYSDFDFSGKSNLQETWTDLLHPDDRLTATTIFSDYVNNPIGKVYESFFRLKHINGSWVWIWSRGGFTRDKSGNLTDKIAGTHIDVTSLKRAEEESQMERTLLRALIDSLPDIIYVKDEHGRKLISNHADVLSNKAKSEAEVIGKTDIELFAGEIGSRGYHDDMEIIKTGTPILNKEELFYDSEGNKNWLLTSKVPVQDTTGKINRIIGIGHNITERKRNEEALKKLNAELYNQSHELSIQARDLKRLNEQLTLQKEQELEKAIAQGKFEIASEVLHDIGNALVGFGSYLNRINRVLGKSNPDAIKNLNLFIKARQPEIASVIGDDKAAALITIGDGIAKTQAESTAEISASVNELLNIITHIQEILNIQRQFVSGHEGVHQRKPANLVNIIDDCKAMLLASFEKRGVIFKTDIKSGNYIVKGDRTKLMQVILNVLKNSLEAIDTDAPEKIITISLTALQKDIQLVIADNGCGFDEDTGGHFFERGFTTKRNGTGLGLYNCKSIIESHAGTFVIKSEGPGLGAVTTITFST